MQNLVGSLVKLLVCWTHLSVHLNGSVTLQGLTFDMRGGARLAGRRHLDGGDRPQGFLAASTFRHCELGPSPLQSTGCRVRGDVYAFSLEGGTEPPALRCERMAALILLSLIGSN